MFGPNAKSMIAKPVHHHRDDVFHGLLQSLEAQMKTTFPRLDDFDLIFVTGSGTMANEIVLSSLNVCTTCLYVEDEFGGRLDRLEKIYRINGPALCKAFCLYETSCSHVNISLPTPTHWDVNWSRVILFADMVSAFPYYSVPEDVDVFTTVSSKQLGAYPVISIIGIRKGLPVDEFFKSETDSVLSLRRYLRFREKLETPATPSIPLYWDLLDVVNKFDVIKFRIKMDERRALLVSLIPADYIIGEGPVFTLVVNDFTNTLAQHFSLYRSMKGYQIFLYAGDDQSFEAVILFIRELLEMERLNENG